MSEVTMIDAGIEGVIPDPTIEVRETPTATEYVVTVPLAWRLKQPSLEVGTNRIAYFVLQALYGKIKA